MKKLLTTLIPLAYGKLYNSIAIFNEKTASKLAFKVFCTIRKGGILPNQKAFLDAAKLGQENVGEHLVQSYRWHGNGETVLLLHGWESNTFRWRNLIQKLQKHDFNIIALDAPAHGYSSGKYLHVPLYAEATRHMMNRYNPKYIVAHSMGGMTTLYDHFKNPESPVEKIVTVGAPSEFSDFMDQYQGLTKFNNRVRAAMNTYLKSWLGYYFHEFSSVRFVANNPKKGLLIHDTKDSQVPFAASQNVHENWKDSKLISTSGFGHSMHQESVNNDIITFLNC